MIKLSYRKALESDIDYLLWLRKVTMYEYLINSGTISSETDQLLRINYLFDKAKIILLNDKNIGLLKLDEKEHIVEIVQIQIDPKFQGKGIGQQIIKAVIDKSQSDHKEISLSVLKENPAKALYLRMGFEIIGQDDTSFMMLYNK